MGGMFGESKFDILQRIPHEYVPRTFRLTPPIRRADVLSQLKAAGLQFPVILKPDIGERGFMVKIIRGEHQLEDYLCRLSPAASVLVQEFIELPLEFGVFYMKMPTEQTGKVIAVVAKEMLSVTGDGQSTLRSLILNLDRARLQWKKLRETYKDRLDEIIPAGKKIELVSIGNHSLGTRFMNGSHLINERLSCTFGRISDCIPEFYFGRFDLRCASLEDLYEGKVKIMELNGCGAEPTHIYDTEFSLWKAMGVLVAHWDRIYRISVENRKRGVQYISLREAVNHYRKFKTVVK